MSVEISHGRVCRAPCSIICTVKTEKEIKKKCTVIGNSCLHCCPTLKNEP